MATSRKTNKIAEVYNIFGDPIRGKSRTLISYYNGLYEKPHREDPETLQLPSTYDVRTPAVFVAGHNPSKERIHRNFLRNAVRYHSNSKLVSDRMKNIVGYHDVDNYRRYTVSIPDLTYDRYMKNIEHTAHNIAEPHLKRPDLGGYFYNLAYNGAVRLEKDKTFGKLAKHRRVKKGKKSYRS